MPSYPFLSDEWLDEARKIRAEYEGKTPPIPHVVRMNLVVTAVPFSDDDIHAHMDTSSGELVLDIGHLEDPGPQGRPSTTTRPRRFSSRAIPRPACRPSWRARSGSRATWPS